MDKTTMTQEKEKLPAKAKEVLDFWFEELTPEQWWKATDIDQTVRERFSILFEEFNNQVPDEWLESPEGCLAAIIVLDQFPRNLFRDTSRAFATDHIALSIAIGAVDKGFDQALSDDQKTFMYIPFQHSEDLEVQKRSVELYGRQNNEGTREFAQQHHDIIAQFGRFPHRNAVLGRKTTEEEQAFLDKGALFW